jgi:hypothetical protein
VQRHACSVTGTQQYRRMESNSANVRRPMGRQASRLPGKPGSGKPTLPTCSRHLRQPRSGKPTHPARGRPPRTRRHRKPTCRRRILPLRGETEIGRPSRNSNGGRKSRPNQVQKEAAITDTPKITGMDPGDGAKTGGCRPNIPDASRAGTPASQASRGGSASRKRCLRRQLTQMLKEGSECFNPDEVRRIIQAARAGPEGSLTAICMLDDNISLFMHAFPDADDRELRAHCLRTLLE